MLKLVVTFCVVSVVVAFPIACPVDGAKDILKSLTAEQQAEVKSIFAEATASNSTVTKAQLKQKLDAFKAQLSPELQAKIAEVIPTGLPSLPTNLSPEAQQVVNQIKVTTSDENSTIAVDRAHIKVLIAAASPEVQAELKEANPFKNCVFPTSASA